MLMLRLVGDVDDPAGDGMTAYAIQPNEMLFTWSGNAEFDQVRMLAIADVGAGYRLLPGVNVSFGGYDQNAQDNITRFQVVVSLIPVATTTTTTTTVPETTTTLPATTTTEAPTTVVETTTTTAAAPVVTTTSAAPTAPVAAALPETGQSSHNAGRALFVVALGLGCIAVARRRRSA